MWQFLATVAFAQLHWVQKWHGADSNSDDSQYEILFSLVFDYDRGI